MNTIAKPLILFVDDEENILRGLARMLRSQNHVWSLRFALGGQQALEMMAQEPADVVVSDMRMPGMDGSELLTVIQKEYPKSTRIVLSGYSDREAILKTIGPSHRYLAKPVSEEALVSSIEAALSLRAYLHKDSVEQIVSGLSYLPVLPRIYGEILTELEAKHGSAEHLSDKIRQDIGISAQLLKIANSAYFNLPQKCASIKQAINCLGFENIRAVILQASVFDQFRYLGQDFLKVSEQLSRRSLAIAVLAQAIARLEGAPTAVADQAFCAGLLLHVGTLVLIAHNASGFKRCMEVVETGRVDLLECEEREFGATHAQVGAYLLGLWGFTDMIVEAVAFHHHPSRYTLKRTEVLTMVHVAQCLCRARNNRNRLKVVVDGLDEPYLRAIGAEKRVELWKELFASISQGWIDF